MSWLHICCFAYMTNKKARLICTSQVSYKITIEGIVIRMQITQIETCNVSAPLLMLAWVHLMLEIAKVECI